MSSFNLYCAITANNGERVPIQISTESSSTELRHKASQATKIPLADLRLIFRGKMIKDDSSPAVSTYQLESDDVVHCMGKPATGPTPVLVPAAAADNLSGEAAAAIPPASSPVIGHEYAVDPLLSALTIIRTSNPPQAYSTAMATLSKVLSNIADNPMEEKYRKVKKGNAAFIKKLGGLRGGDAAMKAVGFVIELQDGTEFYQLHASPEAWPRVMAAKATVDAAAEEAKRALGGGDGNPGATSGAFPGMMGAMPPAAMAGAGANDPMLQSAMAEMSRNPEMMRSMLQVSADEMELIRF
jgi:PUB domain/Ubiquitin family